MDESIVEPFLKAKKDLEVQGIDLQVVDTYRHKSVQAEQYKKSFGTPKEGLVGHPDTSFHVMGRAFDLAQIPEMKDPRIAAALKKAGFIQSRPDDEWWHWSTPD